MDATKLASPNFNHEGQLFAKQRWHLVIHIDTDKVVAERVFGWSEHLPQADSEDDPRIARRRVEWYRRLSASASNATEGGSTESVDG